MFSKLIKRAQLSAKEGNAYKKSGSLQFNCPFKQTDWYSCFLPILCINTKLNQTYMLVLKGGVSVVLSKVN